MNKHKGQSGFTLIEVIIVVAIIGIISMFAIPSYMDSVRKARISQIAQDLVSLAGDIETMRMRGIVYNTTGVGSVAALVTDRKDIKYSGKNIATIVLSGATVRAYTLTATAAAFVGAGACGVMTINNFGERTPVNNDCWRQ